MKMRETSPDPQFASFALYSQDVLKLIPMGVGKYAQMSAVGATAAQGTRIGVVYEQGAAAIQSQVTK